MEYRDDGTTGERELIRLDGICVSFNSIKALRDVHLSVASGEVHAIVGEHGAGKSSLAKVMSGAVQPDSGMLFFDGQCLRSFSRALSLRLGVEAVYHLPQIHPSYSVAENLFIPAGGKHSGLFYHARECAKIARDYLERNNFRVDPTVRVDELNLSQQTAVEVLRALYRKPRLLILDETLERLDGLDREKIVVMLADQKRTGMAIILITHAIDDVFTLADRVSIIREGRLLLTEGTQEIDKISLIQLAYTEILGAGPLRFNKDFRNMLIYNEAILRKLPSPLLVVDNERRVRMLNDQAKAWFKVQLGSHAGMLLEDLFGPSEVAVLELLYKAMEKKRETRQYNLRFEHKKAPTTADVTVLPILDHPRVLGFIIIIQDTTEREKLREQIVLSDNLASVGLLAAGVAHEINNPLATIGNHLEALKYVKCADPVLQELQADIKSQFDYICNTVENLISFANVGKSIDEEIDLCDVVRTIMRLIRMEAERRRIVINVITSAAPSIVRINQNEMKQVLLNLFKNSFEAMPDGGSIAISISPVCTKHGQSVRIGFADTGCGLSCEDPADVFLPFYSTKKTWGKNLGLGLSISYSIIKKHGGEISARNGEVCGCEFEIILPVAGN